MPTPTKGPRLGGGPAHERLMLANLATALFEHGRIVTTETKAKRVRPLAEKMITFAKRGDLHARRQVLTVIRDKDVVHTLFSEIGPRYASRPGGYTRITKLGPRKGDNAPMAQIELVEALTIAQTAVGEAEAARGTVFAKDQAPAQPAAETETTDVESTGAEAAEGADTQVEVAEAEAAEGAETDVEATDDAAEGVAESSEAPAEDAPEVEVAQTAQASDEGQA